MLNLNTNNENGNKEFHKDENILKARIPSQSELRNLPGSGYLIAALVVSLILHLGIISSFLLYRPSVSKISFDTKVTTVQLVTLAPGPVVSQPPQTTPIEPEPKIDKIPPAPAEKPIPKVKKKLKPKPKKKAKKKKTKPKKKTQPKPKE